MSLKVGFFNLQGGTGKTTVAANFAYVLSEFTKTLLIDCDVYCGTIGLIFGLEDKEHNLNTYLNGESTSEEIIYSYDELDVIHADVTSKAFGYKVDIDRFSELISEVSDRYDIIVIDFPPNITEGSLVFNYIGEEDLINKMIIVGEDSIPGIINSLKSIDLANDFSIETAGIVINKFKNISDLTEIADDLLAVLPYSEEVERQWVESAPIVKLNRRNKFSKSMIDFTHTISKELLEKDLTTLRAIRLAKEIGMREE
ncbi:MinD/ParA family ATP-binding protein [Methanocaldococcus infernus]